MPALLPPVAPVLPPRPGGAAWAVCTGKTFFGWHVPDDRYDNGVTRSHLPFFRRPDQAMSVGHLLARFRADHGGHWPDRVLRNGNHLDLGWLRGSSPSSRPLEGLLVRRVEFDDDFFEYLTVNGLAIEVVDNFEVGKPDFRAAYYVYDRPVDEYRAQMEKLASC